MAPEDIVSLKDLDDLKALKRGETIHCPVYDYASHNRTDETVEIKPTKGILHGFRLAAKDGSGYFDCSDDAIMEMLMPYFRILDFQ